jgi:hypothetical protein
VEKYDDLKICSVEGKHALVEEKIRCDLGTVKYLIEMTIKIGREE